MSSRFFLQVFVFMFVSAITTGAGQAQEIHKPHEFFLGQSANATALNENFDLLYNQLNQLNTDKQLQLFSLTKSFSFENSTAAAAQQINQNFDELFFYLNLVHRLYEQPVIQKSHTFQAGEIAYPDQIDGNFDQLYLAVNSVNSLPILPALPFRLPDTGQTASFTPMFGEDHDYSGHASFLVDYNGLTIKDFNTGLMWQKGDDGVRRNWEDANNHCANLTLNGFNDWRLPNTKELHSLVHYGKSKPAVDQNAFPNTNGSSFMNSFYWSSDELMQNLEIVSYFAVSFFFGHQEPYAKTDNRYTRCVRAGSGSGGWDSGYADLGNGTVSDSGTGLIWQKQDDNVTKNWMGAVGYCENLTLAGQTDWRLPNVKELLSIADHSVTHPSVKGTYFPDTDYLEVYWTSTTFEEYPHTAWGVSFNYGTVENVAKSKPSYVRCVKDQS